MRMIVELDHCVDGHEYEEIVAIYAKGTEVRRWNLWRSWDEVIVQPLIGRSMRFFTWLKQLTPCRRSSRFVCWRAYMHAIDTDHAQR